MTTSQVLIFDLAGVGGFPPTLAKCRRASQVAPLHSCGTAVVSLQEGVGEEREWGEEGGGSGGNRGTMLSPRKGTR